MSLEQQMDTAEKALGHVVQVRFVRLFTPRKVLAGKPKCLETLSRKCMVGRTSFCFMQQRCLTVCFLLRRGSTDCCRLPWRELCSLGARGGLLGLKAKLWGEAAVCMMRILWINKHHCQRCHSLNTGRDMHALKPFRK